MAKPTLASLSIASRCCAKRGKSRKLREIILAIPPDPKKIADLDEWWAERRELAYGALGLGKMKLAYRLVNDAGPLTVNPLKEQTFMAGWIAFRYLDDIRAAEKHFAIWPQLPTAR